MVVKPFATTSDKLLTTKHKMSITLSRIFLSELLPSIFYFLFFIVFLEIFLFSSQIYCFERNAKI